MSPKFTDLLWFWMSALCLASLSVVGNDKWQLGVACILVSFVAFANGAVRVCYQRKAPTAVTLLILALVASAASPAGAGTLIEIAHVRFTHLANEPWPLPLSASVSIEQADTWTIPTITGADVGRTWTLNAANADSYGFDWAGTEAEFAKPPTGVGAHFSDGSGGSYLANFLPTREFALDRMTLQLVNWDEHFKRNGVDFYWTQAVARVYAVIPEPSALELCVFGLALCCLHRQYPMYCRT